MDEAELRETETGRIPSGPGWFIANVGELSWTRDADHGTWCAFEDPDDRSKQLGIGVHVLEPGQPDGRYHAEGLIQEGFLVLSGECIAIVEGAERRMRQWDYLHCPPGTFHILVGAGKRPCALLMVSDRSEQNTIHYPVNEPAARYGASVARDTDSPQEAYADLSRVRTSVPAPWPPADAG